MDALSAGWFRRKRSSPFPRSPVHGCWGGTYLFGKAERAERFTCRCLLPEGWGGSAQRFVFFLKGKGWGASERKRDDAGCWHVFLRASKNRMDWSCAASGMVGTRDDPDLNESATSLTTYISCFDGGSRKPCTYRVLGSLVTLQWFWDREGAKRREAKGLFFSWVFVGFARSKLTRIRPRTTYIHA